MKLLCGIGISDMSGVSHTKEYKLWAGMINRCHNELFHKNKLSYAKCWVSDDFLAFSKFHNWCQNQIGFNQPNFELDKDLLEKGNKEYHPDKCVFLPRELNLFLRRKPQVRGLYPIGVTINRFGNYTPQISIKGRNVHLGTFKTIEQAFQAYKHAKENHIKLLAEKYRDQIDPRAYEALLNYEVEITD